LERHPFKCRRLWPDKGFCPRELREAVKLRPKPTVRRSVSRASRTAERHLHLPSRWQSPSMML
jgi:hypothetical protein